MYIFKETFIILNYPKRIMHEEEIKLSDVGGDEEAVKLRRERNDIMHKIELIKARYLQGEMEEKIYMDIS